MNKTTTKTLHEVASQYLKDLGLTKGSTVRVIAKAQSRSAGWSNSWTDDMDRYVGKVCTVDEEGISEHGIRLDVGETTYRFPAHVLEVVKIAPSEVVMDLTSYYTAVIDYKNRTVTVKDICSDSIYTTVTFNRIDSLKKLIDKN